MIDSHSHIYTERFNEDRGDVLARAREVGITQLLQVGCNLAESRTVVALAESIPGVYASVGVHPHDAVTVDEPTLDAIESLSAHPKVLSWGEMGLDFYYDNSPREVQIEAFRAQMMRAQNLDLPIVIHTRDAEPETLEVLKAFPIKRGGHIHCFTGTNGMAQELLELGFHIGFTGIITFKSAKALREVVANVPLERLLIETDSPYLAPTPHRGKRNEPAFVAEVAKKVAEIKETTVEEVIRVTSANFYQVYGKPNMTWEALSEPAA
jgi:TatD DNase family protein